MYKNIVTTEEVSSKNTQTLYMFFFFSSAVCVCVVQVKIRLLADPHCVGDGNSLLEPWGSCTAGEGVRARLRAPWMCLCVCVHISAGKGRAGPTVHVSTAKSSTLLIQPSGDVFVFLTVLVCVCAFEELHEKCCHEVRYIIH